MTSTSVRRLTALSASAGLLLTLTALAQPASAAPPGPVITSLSVKAGPTAGSTRVIIQGTGFDGTTRVTFGGPAALNYTVVGPTAIIATSEAHSAGKVFVRVYKGSSASPATEPSAFTYQTTDTTALPAPTGVTAANTYGVLIVKWTPSPAKDVSGYNIYAKFRGDTAWSKVGSNTYGYLAYYEETEQHTLVTRFASTAYTGPLFQVAISALDSFGHESAKSAVVNGATAPAAQTYFNRDPGQGEFIGRPEFYDSFGGGVVIDRNVTWGPDMAKVIGVGGPLTIRPGATLTLLPGTIVKLQASHYGQAPLTGPILVQAGAGLVANGTAAKPVILTKNFDPVGGQIIEDLGASDLPWWGIATTTGSNVSLTNTQIRYSEHGLTWCPSVGDGNAPCGS